MTTTLPQALERWRALPLPSRLVALAVAGEIGLTVALLHAPAELALVFVVLLAGTAALVLAHFALPAAERDPLLTIFAAGWLLRVTAMLVIRFAVQSPENPHGFLMRDSVSYDRVGWNLAEHWRRGYATRLSYHTAGYTIGFHYAVAAVYTVAGHVPLLVTALITLISASMMPLTFLLGRELAGRRAGLTAAFFIAIWPPVIFWSSQLLKDMLIAFLLLVSVLFWIAFTRRPRLVHLALALVATAPCIFLRGYIFVFWAVGMAVGLIVRALSRQATVRTVVLALAVVGLGWWAAVEYSVLGLGDLNIMIAQLSSVATVPGSMFAEVRYRSVHDLLAFLPKGALRFLLTPLPWRTALLDWPEAVGAVMRYALLPFAAVGLVHLLRVKRAAVAPAVTCAVLTVMLYAAAFRGGLPRHWAQFYPYLFVAAAVGFKRFPSWPVPVAIGGLGFVIAVFAFGLV